MRRCINGGKSVDSEAAAQEIVIITGLSGAGRSTAAKSLEDMDWFVADNLPAGLLPTMAELARRASGTVPRLAAVVDIRSRAFSTDLKSAISELRARGMRPYVVFLEASDETLVRRFDSVSRPHPLQEAGRVVDGIAAERELMEALRAEADLVLDTTVLNVHELRARMRDAFATESEASLQVSIVSFGFKYGLPVDADMVADCRFLPNPHWVPELAPLTGRDQAVIDYVLGQPGAADFLDAFGQAVQIALAGYDKSGRHYVLLAVGCTGGKHRSVAMADALAERLSPAWPGIQVTHRDLGRE
jgi:RNase adapter protein RapZ